MTRHDARRPPSPLLQSSVMHELYALSLFIVYVRDPQHTYVLQWAGLTKVMYDNETTVYAKSKSSNVSYKLYSRI